MSSPAINSEETTKTIGREEKIGVGQSSRGRWKFFHNIKARAESNEKETIYIVMIQNGGTVEIL